MTGSSTTTSAACWAARSASASCRRTASWPANGTEASQINLFLHRVTPNTGWRNEGLPSRDGSGRQRLANAPLALNLHYLLSAYSNGDLHAEILLGYAMQLLHETPVLTRQAIQMALSPSPDVGTALPPALRALADSGLENQIEQIKITPEYLDTEEISKLWTATLSHFRPTAAYMASVVLIQAREPVGSPLPVLSRGPVDPISHRDRGVVVQAGLVPPLPMLEVLARRMTASPSPGWTRSSTSRAITSTAPAARSCSATTASGSSRAWRPWRPAGRR